MTICLYRVLVSTFGFCEWFHCFASFLVVFGFMLLVKFLLILYCFMWQTFPGCFLYAYILTFSCWYFLTYSSYCLSFSLCCFPCVLLCIAVKSMCSMFSLYSVFSFGINFSLMTSISFSFCVIISPSFRPKRSPYPQCI